MIQDAVKITLEGVVAVIRRAHDNHFLIAERPQHKPLGGYWEFPGGKVDEGETREEALKREILEELGVKVLSYQPFLKIYHEYPDFAVNLHIYLVENFEGQGQGLEGQQVKWVDFQNLKDYSFPPATPPLLEKIQQCFKAP